MTVATFVVEPVSPGFSLPKDAIPPATGDDDFCPAYRKTLGEIAELIRDMIR